MSDNAITVSFPRIHTFDQCCVVWQGEHWAGAAIVAWQKLRGYRPPACMYDHVVSVVDCKDGVLSGVHAKAVSNKIDTIDDILAEYPNVDVYRWRILDGDADAQSALRNKCAVTMLSWVGVVAYDWRSIAGFAFAWIDWCVDRVRAWLCISPRRKMICSGAPVWALRDRGVQVFASKDDADDVCPADYGSSPELVLVARFRQGKPIAIA